MSYKVLYRKYRPKSFTEMVGQKAVVQTLFNALQRNKISHAYLFAGPRGTGKTSMAKLFAKAINCEKGSGEICNECDNCRSANENKHPDIVEIDAASNNGINEVRSIIEKAKFAPLKGKYKVYIIDEVHMMSDSAFNALLKTLEEPPAHVIFILATTEPHKILPTILSRCQRYDFSKISDSEIATHLAKILAEESISFEERALLPIVSIADGGMRDALMMLDQVLAYTSDFISEKDVLELFGVASIEEKINLIINIANHNANEVLSVAQKLTKSGIDIRRLVASLVEILKDLLIYITTNEPSLLQTLREIEVKKMENILNIDQINSLIEILLEADNNFRIVNNPQSLLEITLLKMLTFNKPKIVEKEVEIKKENESKNPAPKINESNSNSNYESPLINKVPPIKSEGSLKKIDDNTMIKIMVNGSREDRITLVNIWQQELSNLKSDPIYSSYATILLDGNPFVVTDNVLVISQNFERLANKLNIIDNQQGLSAIAQILLKRKVYVYGVTHAEELRLKKLFLDLRQLNKLPKKEEIVIEED